jgi:hypothetical protein
VRPRIGAYLLTGDPTWLASSLARYYDLLDDLVVLVPRDGRSWTGKPLPVADCLEAIRLIDVRGKARVVEGDWVDRDHPLRAENAQRQEGLDQLADMDWILQIDSDELLPAPERLVELLRRADDAGADAVEWPMRVLYRQLHRLEFLAVVDRDRGPRYEYPGPIAVRPGARLVDCRRPSTGAGFLRPVVTGDNRSPHVATAPGPGEHRLEMDAEDAIIHNSWGRSAASVWNKLESSAHQLGVLRPFYFSLVWLPSPLTWRVLRNIHPLNRKLWPRLVRASLPAGLVLEGDLAATQRRSKPSRPRGGTKAW